LIQKGDRRALANIEGDLAHGKATLRSERCVFLERTVEGDQVALQVRSSAAGMLPPAR